MSIATWVMPARNSGVCSSIQATTVLTSRPLICANRPWSPVMSTMPVSNRSTHVRTPVAGSVSHLALPRLVSSIPSTRIGVSCCARTGSAIATTARWQVFQVVP